MGIDRLYEDFDYDAYSYTFALTSIGYLKNIKSAFIESKAGFGINIEGGHDDFCDFIGIEPGIIARLFDK